MDFKAFFNSSVASHVDASEVESDPSPKLRVSGLTFTTKPSFEKIIPSLKQWGQNVLLLG